MIRAESSTWDIIVFKILHDKDRDYLEIVSDKKTCANIVYYAMTLYFNI